MKRFVLDTPSSSLKCELHHLDAAGHPGMAAILLHPWARLGGSMHDPVVETLMEACAATGMFSTLVRYNQSGTLETDVQDLVCLSR